MAKAKTTGKAGKKKGAVKKPPRRAVKKPPQAPVEVQRTLFRGIQPGDESRTIWYLREMLAETQFGKQLGRNTGVADARFFDAMNDLLHANGMAESDALVSGPAVLVLLDLLCEKGEDADPAHAGQAGDSLPAASGAYPDPGTGG